MADGKSETTKYSGYRPAELIAGDFLRQPNSPERIAILIRALKRAEAVMQGIQDVAPTETMREALYVVRDAIENAR